MHEILHNIYNIQINIHITQNNINNNNQQMPSYYQSSYSICHQLILDYILNNKLHHLIDQRQLINKQLKNYTSIGLFSLLTQVNNDRLHLMSTKKINSKNININNSIEDNINNNNNKGIDQFQQQQIDDVTLINKGKQVRFYQLPEEQQARNGQIDTFMSLQHAVIQNNNDIQQNQSNDNLLPSRINCNSNNNNKNNTISNTINIKSSSEKSSQQNKHKNIKKQQLTNKPSVSTKTIKIMKNAKNQHLHKLPVETDEIDQIINGIRVETNKRYEKKKLQYQKHKLDDSHITKKNNESNNNSKQLNYDYEGTVIPIKSQQKQNLVKKNIEANVQQTLQKYVNKKININNNDHNSNKKKGQYIQTRPISNFQSKNKNILNQQQLLNKKRSLSIISNSKPIIPSSNNIQFSHINNLIQNINIEQGVKAVFQRDIHENYKTSQLIDVDAIKKSLQTNRKKLSRNQYDIIKSNNNRNTPNMVREQLKILRNQKVQQQDIDEGINNDEGRKDQKRLKNNNRKKIRAVTEHQSASINLGNNGALRKLIDQQIWQDHNTGIDEGNKDNHIEGDHNKQSSDKKLIISELNRIDKYNLQYTRNKGLSSYQPRTTTNNLNKKSIQLPKLTATTKNNKHNATSTHINAHRSISNNSRVYPPKTRQRVKQPERKSSNKKFEDNLRV